MILRSQRIVSRSQGRKEQHPAIHRPGLQAYPIPLICTCNQQSIVIFRISYHSNAHGHFRISLAGCRTGVIFFASFRRTETKGRRARFALRARLAFAIVRLTEIRKKNTLYHLGNTIPLFLSTLFSNYQLHNFSYVAPKVERIPAYINRASINWL